MKILIDAHLSENKLTGIGKYINNLVYGLLDIDMQNEYLLLVQDSLTHDHPLMKIEADNFSIEKVAFRGLSLQQHLKMRYLFKKFKPDIYHHPHFDLPSDAKTPAVITIHDLKYLRRPAFFQNLSMLKRNFIYWQIEKALKNARKIITVSDATQNDLVELFNVNRQKMITIYHGIESLRFSGSLSFNAETFKTKNLVQKPYILFVGERRPHKNLVGLIKSFRLLSDIYTHPYNLIIVGKSYSKYKYPEKLVRKMRLSKNVIFCDYVDEKELIWLYQNAEVFILPSFYEGFGFPVLEAMKYSVPVIGSNTTALPEIIGDAGLLVDPNNFEEMARAIRRVLSSEKLRQDLINKGLKRAQEFTWERTAQKTLEVYQEIYNTLN